MLDNVKSNHFNKDVNWFSDIMSLINYYEEIIIYGAGEPTQRLLRCLFLKGNLNEILCIAVKDNEHELINPRFVYKVPVVSIDNLTHFAKTACFIVCVKNDNDRITIHNELTKKGIFNVFLCNDNCLEDMNNVLHEMNTKGVFDKYMENLLLEYRSQQAAIDENNEICEVHKQTFSSYHNCNRGRDVVVLASGPTAANYKKIEGALHIGMNNSYKLGIPLDYYFIQDGARRGEGIHKFDDGIKQVNCDIFIGRYSGMCQYRSIEFPENIEFINSNIKRYFLDTRFPDKIIYKDIRYHPLMDFFTVAFPAFHFALFTHPQRIYLVGEDITNQYGLHFYKESSDTASPKANCHDDRKIKLGWALAKQFAFIYYPDIEIISVNPVELRGLFKDQST